MIKFIKRLFRGKDKLDALYKNNDYLTAYSRHSDMRVEKDPKAAIGGKWEELGALQFEYLCKHGLKPEHYLLDYGCGTLRGGRHFIDYLNNGKYTGIDISEGVIREAQKFVSNDELLNEKQPALLLNEDMDLKFDDLEGIHFDYILAQSVFTHLKSEHIEEIFQNLHKVMKEQSVFFFTMFVNNKAKGEVSRNYKDFEYPASFIKELSKKYGYHVQEMDDYPHPAGQTMFKLTNNI